MMEAPVARPNSDEGWPSDFGLTNSGGVEEGLRVLSRSGVISGRTTGSRQRCSSTPCPGWFVGIRWETGQLVFACSRGWRYDAATRSIRITGGGEISARFVSPEPLGVDPLPPEQWPTLANLSRFKGWRGEHRDLAE
jgi:hypothetical protein